MKKKTTTKKAKPTGFLMLKPVGGRFAAPAYRWVLKTRGRTPDVVSDVTYTTKFSAWQGAGRWCARWSIVVREEEGKGKGKGKGGAR